MLSWKWCSAWWCCRWSSSVLRIKAVCQSVREATTASGVDNVASPTGRHRWTGYFTLREADPMQKQLEGTQKYINERPVQIELPVDGQLIQLLWAIHTRFQRSIMPKVIKPSNPFTNVCWVSVLTTFLLFLNLLHRQFFLLPNSKKRRNDGWWFPLVLLLPVCFEQ